jgi:glutamate racemase
MKIGVFDSGFGGLNVFKHISEILKEHDLVYLGDTARAPYGNRSQETIYEYVKQGVEFLFSKDCNLIVLACNTASSEALRKIQQEYIPDKYPERNVLGVLIPVAEEVVDITTNKRVGVLATEGTISSGAYVREIQKIDPDIQVFGQSAPLLVPMIESRDENDFAITSAISEYIDPLIASAVDTIILGCTHYGILKYKIKEVLDKKGENITLVSGEDIVAQKLKNYLFNHSEFNSNISRNGNREYYTTDLGEKFDDFGSELMGEKIESVRISLG